MKKFSRLALGLLLVAVFFLPPPTLAAINSGAKPGSFFYFFDTALEQIELLFTFDPEKKVTKALKYADERLAEIEAIAKEKNPNTIKAAITNYESNINLATEKSKEVKDKGRAESLLTLIKDNASRDQEVLSTVLIKVPDEARGVITQAIEASRKGREEAARQIAELKGEVEQLKKEIVELKLSKVETKQIEQDTKKIKTENNGLEQHSKEQQEQILKLQEEIAKINNPLKTPCPYTDRVPSCYVPCKEQGLEYCSSEWIPKNEYALGRTSNPDPVYATSTTFEWSVYSGEWWTNGPSDKFRPLVNELITITYGDQIVTANTDEKGIARFNLRPIGNTGSNPVIYSSRFQTVQTDILER